MRRSRRARAAVGFAAVKDFEPAICVVPFALQGIRRGMRFCSAPTGLLVWVDVGPRAMPWAIIGSSLWAWRRRPCGTVEGADWREDRAPTIVICRGRLSATTWRSYVSPGRRPGSCQTM